MDYVLDYVIREKYKVGEFTAGWQPCLHLHPQATLCPLLFFFFTGVFLSNSHSSNVFSFCLSL